MPSFVWLKYTLPLRIPAIHGGKTTKNQTPLVHFAWLFYNQTVCQKSVWHFFDQVARDANMCKHLKSALWWQSWNSKHKKLLTLWHFQFHLCHYWFMKWCHGIYSLPSNTCIEPSSTVPSSLIVWLLFPSIFYCGRDRDIGTVIVSYFGQIKRHTIIWMKDNIMYPDKKIILA